MLDNKGIPFASRREENHGSQEKEDSAGRR